MKKNYQKPEVRVHHNLYSRGNNGYGKENAVACAEAMATNGWHLPVWLTQNQIENICGKYAFNGIRVKNGEKSQVTIIKHDNAGFGYIYTPVYNIDQTNFKTIAPGAYDLLCQGKTFEEVSDILMHQPLLTRAMHIGEQTPKSFWKSIAAVF